MKVVDLLSCAVLAFTVKAVAGADAREIVQLSVERDARNASSSPQYTFLQREETRELDRSGAVRSRKIETWDVTLLEGSPYKRLVARNDKPLSPEEQKWEEEKLRRSIEERRKETVSVREQRLAEWRKRQERQRQPIREVPDAFNFTMVGEETLEGRPVYVIAGTPKPGYKPRSPATAFLPKLKLRVWIDKGDYQAARIEAETTDTVSFGGFLVRVAKGSRLVIEQTRVNDEIWLPKRVTVNASARLFLLKGFNREFDFTFSDYKKFQVDSRVIALGTTP